MTSSPADNKFCFYLNVTEFNKIAFGVGTKACRRLIDMVWKEKGPFGTTSQAQTALGWLG